jgi:hypothetical protein
MVLFSVEYLKIVASLSSGFLGARVWFAKEIAAGKALLKYYEHVIAQKASAIGTAVKTDVKKVETVVSAEVKKVENKL